MRIDTKESIAGIPLLKIRDLLKDTDTHTVESTTNFLEIDTAQAVDFLTELTRYGYLEKMPASNEPAYRNTIQGNALSLSKAVASISKEKATRLFDEFMQRVHQVNADDSSLFTITRVVLFGSFITDAATVNDIDIALTIVRKEEDFEKFKMAMENKRASGEIKRRYFSNLVEKVHYFENQLRVFLKARSRYLSLHDGDDAILDHATQKQVFPKN